MSDIQISDVTNATALSDGTGAFDVLICAVERRIEAQFQKQRLTGTDYATVYLGALTAVLQQSIQFVLAEEKAGLDADLVAEEILKTQNETDTVIASTSKVYSEIGLLEQKTVTELAQTSDPSGGILKEQWDLLVSQGLLYDQKIVTETAQTTDPTGGITKAQQDLYVAQTKGFAGKHENEVLKRMLDTWAVIYSINDGELAGTDVGTPEFLLKTGASSFDMPDVDAQVNVAAAIYD